MAVQPQKIIIAVCLCLVWFTGLSFAISEAASGDVYRISVADYRDKAAGAWLGQIIGVSIGGPTEFKYSNTLVPEDEIPAWTPDMINGSFWQDDLYVEMTFLETIIRRGWNFTSREAGIDFANSRFDLWWANDVARRNLRKGIAPPDCSNPLIHGCTNAIDYQIEADYSGIIAPGMLQIPVDLGWKIGHLMNYGDGVYAGQFVGGMYSAAFVCSDIRQIIERALTCIPAECQYAGMVRDVLAWHDETPDDWKNVWQRVQDRYYNDPAYLKAAPTRGHASIDAKLNGAMVLIGLLYGGGDIEQTARISTMCGHDSDCNPSTAVGVLCTMLGQSGMDAKFFEKLDHTARFAQ